MNSSLLLSIVLFLYLASMLIGWLLGKKGVLDIVWFMKRRQKGKILTDPLTVKMQHWLDKYKMNSLKHKKWFRFGALIFVNNFVFVAFISRTVYGIIFVIPVFLTIWGGLAQGVALSNSMVPKLDMKSALMGIFEFGGYIFATVAGVNLGLSFFKNGQSIVSSFVVALHDLIYIYPIVVLFLMLGACLETSFIKMSAHKIDPNFDFDREKMREAALRMLQNKMN